MLYLNVQQHQKQLINDKKHGSFNILKKTLLNKNNITNKTNDYKYVFANQCIDLGHVDVLKRLV